MSTESNASIAELLRAPEPTVSVEFFPPKTEEGARQILKTAQALRPHNIAFASITYGAGGSTQERTADYGDLLQNLFGFRVVPHLTCIGHSKENLAKITDGFLDAKFPGVMALRGDPPKGETEFKPVPNGPAHASELVSLIRERQRFRDSAPNDFSIGVAGYPEKHPESPDFDTDLRHLAHKVAQGADFITTQLFFDNAAYFTFVRRCREAGINVPVLPGILPALSLAQAKKFVSFGAKLPEELEQRLLAAENDPAASRRAGLDWAHDQIRGLLDSGAPGFHLYIMNRAETALELFERLR
jgi:methylenetetrahydrofolate reductase (NADPH)